VVAALHCKFAAKQPLKLASEHLEWPLDITHSRHSTYGAEVEVEVEVVADYVARVLQS